jgi:hypothetical protein
MRQKEERVVAEEVERRIEREIRSPGSAALAGIVYSILMMTIMLLTRRMATADPEQITRDWLEARFGTVSLVLTLMPFAGIAFLWFTGVVRDRLGRYEDKFFSTIFLSSGIITVLLLLLWAAIFGAMLDTTTLTGIGLIDRDIYLFGYTFMNQILGNYALRIAGVYMTAIGTLWYKTRVMPRWLTLITYVLALGFLVGAQRIREARFIFPVWVLVVSVYILILNYRQTHHQKGKEEEPVYP